MIDVLRMLLNLSDQQFDPVAKNELRSLLDAAPPAEAMRDGLREILDKCVHGSLCSAFEIRVLDMTWQHYGGKPSDPAPWRAA